MKCKFFSWELEAACHEAWEIARNLGWVTADGRVSSSMVANATRIDIRTFADDRVLPYLTRDGSAEFEWEKARTPRSTLADGTRFEVHFYRNSVREYADASLHFKVVFLDALP